MKLLVALSLTLTTILAFGQYNRLDSVFKYNRPKEFRNHFKITPSNIEMAINQLDSDFKDEARKYFKSLPEEIAMLQFGNVLYMLIFHWKLEKKNDQASSLVDYFTKNGASGDETEIIRLCIAALHRKLNNKSYTISDLADRYGNIPFKRLVETIRNVSVGDTVYGNWFNAEKYFHHFSYTAWFKVIGKHEATETLKLKIFKLTISNKSVTELQTKTIHWKVGDVIEWKNGVLENWKEGIKMIYPRLE